MNGEKIVLFARLKVRADAVEAAKKLALGIVADSRSETGCHNYDVHQAIEDPTVFFWHETWENRAALDNHFELPYFQDFYVKAGALASEEPQITVTRMISEK
ncbi:MAG TPA: putative quinol monooxygenase [Pyrinomonadaceae bacterium]|jgi:quinol monooxygenase YgiN